LLGHFLSFSFARAFIDSNREAYENAQRPTTGLILIRETAAGQIRGRPSYRNRNHKCRDRTLTISLSAEIFH
jgi:N-formylglutamate amidohydrolase